MNENNNQGSVNTIPDKQKEQLLQEIPSNTVASQNTNASNSLNNLTSKNTIWGKTIPILNIVFMVLSLGFILIIDIPIAVKSPELRPFLYAMLTVLGIFSIFFYLENYSFKRKFINSQSKLDPYFIALLVIRNLFFLLNVIPFIQLIGLILIGSCGVPLLIVYIIMMIYRNKST